MALPAVFPKATVLPLVRGLTRSIPDRDAGPWPGEASAISEYLLIEEALRQVPPTLGV